MQEVVLCDDTVKITVRPNHSGAVLTIAQGHELHFPLSKTNLAGILDGETIQFSYDGVFCKLTRYSDDIRVIYAWKGTHSSSTCPAADVERFLQTLNMPA